MSTITSAGNSKLKRWRTDFAVACRAFCLTFAAILLGGWMVQERPSSQPVALTASSYSPTIKSTAIESLRVGDRVMGERSAGEMAGETQVDPATWRRLQLYAEAVWPDGTLDDIHIETLQPPEWVAQFGAVASAHVPIPLDLAEIGLPADLTATVVANDPGLSIKPGPGRVVTATFHHQAVRAIDITIDGLEKPIGCTINHPFWSETRQEFVEAGKLTVGEELLTLEGTTKITAITPRGPPEPVYNLEVHGEHVYLVADSGILVHNICKQARLRALLTDPNVSKADKGWIKQELNQIALGKRNNIRLPGSSRVRTAPDGRVYGGNSGKSLAHRRGFEHRKGFGWEYADLQDVDLHKLQHHYEGYR